MIYPIPNAKGNLLNPNSTEIRIDRTNYLSRTSIIEQSSGCLILLATSERQREGGRENMYKSNSGILEA